MSKGIACAPIAVAILCSLSIGSIRAEEVTEEKVKEVARQFVQAVKAKDIEALMKVSGVPWFDPFEELVIKDRMELRRYWQDRLSDLDASTLFTDGITATPYKKYRNDLKKFGFEELREVTARTL